MAREKIPGLAIAIGLPKHGKADHDEPDDDEGDGKDAQSDGDGDELPAGALQAYREFKSADDDTKACAALLRLCELGRGEE